MFLYQSLDECERCLFFLLHNTTQSSPLLKLFFLTLLCLYMSLYVLSLCLFPFMSHLHLFLSLSLSSSERNEWEKVILIQHSNSQCNHREYAINGESLQSIAHCVYSYTSSTLYSSFFSHLLLQLLPSIPPASSSPLLSAASTLLLHV